MTYEIRCADVFEGLAAMPERSVHCCVTSPPYWALRQYLFDGASVFRRESSLADKVRTVTTLDAIGVKPKLGVMIYDIKEIPEHLRQYFTDAPQLGQEKTPQEFVATLVRVFADVHRVLRDDGVLFVNLGDTYQDKQRRLIPERFVIAMQEAGWYVRDIICWHKPAPMPVSVRDRCTPAWEPIYQFTKSPRYFWDQEAVKVASAASSVSRLTQDVANQAGSYRPNKANGPMKAVGDATANPRNVWRIATEPLKAAHYAAFPSELPTRCIKAATSERGVCSKCLAPWVRVVERKRVATRPGVDSKVNVEAYGRTMYPEDHPNQRHSGDVCGNRDPQRHCTATNTVDWKPSCDCNTGTIPATVLDPFSGAGTTCLAAHRLGRHGIGLELNPEYCKLSIGRIESDQPEDSEPTSTMLFDIAEQGELFTS